MEKYLEDLLPLRDELLQEMEETALAETIPVVTPAVGNFLQLLVQINSAQSILEIGTAIGYSTIYLGRGARQTGGRVLTVDMNKGRLDRAREYIKRAGLEDYIDLRLENALHFLKEHQGKFDFIFIDAAKGEYLEYLELTIPFLQSGGLLVVDNVLFRGWVVPGSVYEPKYERMVSRMRKFLDELTGLKDFSCSVLPFGDGIAVARKEHDAEGFLIT
jgi:predicted O-methyltransferase YrrM